MGHRLSGFDSMKHLFCDNMFLSKYLSISSNPNSGKNLTSLHPNVQGCSPFSHHYPLQFSTVCIYTHYTVYIIHILQLIPNNPLTVLYILIIQNRDTLFFSHALNTKKINIILRGPIHLGGQPVWIYILINLKS